MSTQAAARSAIRRPPQAGQKPRVLQEKGTSSWWSRSLHISHAKPSSGSPQARKASTSRVADAAPGDAALRFAVTSDRHNREARFAWAVEHGHRLVELSPERQDLADVFRRLTVA